MERRALLAVVLSLLILLVYEQAVRYYFPPPPPSEQDAAQPPGPTPSVPAEIPPPAVVLPAPTTPEKLILVETPLYTATFSTTGARLTSFRLKHYRTAVEPDSQPQEMILPGVMGEAPVGVELRGPQGVEAFSDLGLGYVADKEGLTLQGQDEGSIDFTSDALGMTLHKQFVFRSGNYEVSGKIDLSKIPAGYNELLLSWSTAAGAKLPAEIAPVFDKALYLNGKKRTEQPFSALQKGEIVEGDIRWTGYGGQHFFAGLALDEARNQRLWWKLRDTTVEQKLLLPLSGESAKVPIEIFIGPKDVDALEQAGHNFARVVDLGWFGFIAVPLLHGLQLSHRVTHNYGFDIILLTVVIKVLFIPLTRSSFKSMQAMQKLQPQMQKIREKLKDSPEQMNKEIMDLYRRYKVNPFGGCLPMILQIPVFIGLYTALTHAIELRHAPFLFWIHDLAAPDRLGSIQLPFVQHPGIPVLTLFMGASMFLQQWMTPAVGDPSQRQVMMIMPLMFTFMFVNFPSGLSLYWLVNNVLTIAQQYYMNRNQPKYGG